MLTVRQCRTKNERDIVFQLIAQTIAEGEIGLESNTPLKNIVVVCLDKKIIGGGIIELPQQLDYDTCWAINRFVLKKNRPFLGYISFIAVNPEYQGRGAGVLLVNKLLQKLQKQGCTQVFTHVWAESPGNASYKTFSKCGFVLKRTIKYAWADTENYHCVKCGNGQCKCTCKVMLWKQNG